MPLFALANAGVSIAGASLAVESTRTVMFGVAAALVLGKPLGICGASWLAVQLRWCELPSGVSWGGVWLVGALGGIGFTMSIFIATLAFEDGRLLAAAKLGVVIASAIAGTLGLGAGRIYMRRE
jgi:NhaA family Na+:H+ antiporter